MTRVVEASDGLALLGTGRIGELAFPVPWLAVPETLDGATDPGTLGLSSEVVPPGRRRILLRRGGIQLAVEFTVPTPEVSGIPGTWETAGPGVAVVHAPLSDADEATLRAANPALVVLGNARALLAEGRAFVDAVQRLRACVGAGAILWAPRVALPHRTAFLVYAGVDLIDGTEAILQGGTDPYEPALGTLDEDALRSEGLADPREGGATDGASRATAALERELRLVRACIRAGRLRELVEARLTAEPLLAEALRYLDADSRQLLEERTPVTGGPLRTYILAESLRRPEVARYRSRFLERYRPPRAKEVLLLVPCSKTKPYRNSHSHRRFSRALEGLPALARIHTVSVTSPLGLVPRELEDVPPCRQYDIPVTGEWNEAERGWVIAALQHLLKAGSYRAVVVHLDPDEYAFLRPELEQAGPARWTLTDHRSTAPAALSDLRSAIEDAGRDARLPPGGPLAVVREELHEIASFQFGRPAAELLFAPPVRLHGRPWSQRLTDGAGVDLATWQETRGLFHLTAPGGVRIAPARTLWVDVADEVELKGDLFTPGVASADPAIRAGDDVVLTRKGAAVAVGEARLPGRLMKSLPHGLAVSVRHRVHSPPGPTGR